MRTIGSQTEKEGLSIATSVRYIDCSNLMVWQIMKALGVSERRNLERFVSVQAYYSLAGRDLEHDLAPMIDDQKLGLIVWSPLAGGFLSGKYDRNSERGVSRRDKVEFPPINREKTFDIIDVLRVVADRHSVSAAQIALSWLLVKPVVSTVIVGARRVDQLQDNIGAVDIVLSQQDIEELDTVSDTGPHYPNWVQAGTIATWTPRGS
jgi:aryl-alcohol dehydrogenase-like predicted oxidoreductase